MIDTTVLHTAITLLLAFAAMVGVAGAAAIAVVRSKTHLEPAPIHTHTQRRDIRTYATLARR
ncbi:hypothetical protein [Planotetraspora sp. GP83]|uniref:hypothetical protein n=1 Tax=Planotetraspora sp. GP83 TaxID=3156264 RepID=UPI0035111D44